MKYEINTPQPKRNKKKFEAMHKERQALLKLPKEQIIEMYLECRYSVKGMTKGFTMPIFKEAVTFKKNSADARRDAAQEQFQSSAKAFGKKLIDNHIELNERLTAGKCIQKLRDKGVPEIGIPDDKTVRGYIKHLLTTASKVPKVKKVL